MTPPLETVVDWGNPLPAPAKLNLFLHVVGRRPDGYHLLQSAFRLVDRCDILRFYPGQDDSVRLARPLPCVPEESDLCVRAARLLQESTGYRGGVLIDVQKSLPMGGGLGGGSSDAATVLLALNRLWKLGLTRPALMQLGLKLGADVPFFIFGRNAFVEGIGENMQTLPLGEDSYLVVVPPLSVPTAKIFSDPTLTRNTEIITIADFPARGGVDFGRNDLEPVACRHYPEVGQALTWLGQFGPARMSGSGACVFGHFRSRDAAAQALSQVPLGWTAWLTQGLEAHPLLHCAE